MPSAFATRFQARHNRLEKRFGESVQFMPWVAGGYLAGGPDPDRPARQIDGVIFSETPTEQRTSGDAIGHGRFGVLIPGDKIMASFPASAFTTPDDWPRDKDRLARIDAPGAPVFALVKPQFDGVSEIMAALTEVNE